MNEGSASGAWTWVDAWLLAATADSRNGCSLSEMIGAADGINHAIPTRQELSATLGALIASGLIEVTGERFRTTSAGSEIKRHWSGGLFGWSDSMLPHLNKLPRSADDLPLTEEAVQAAYKAYVRRNH